MKATTVEQKFSRFSTDCDAEEKGACAGNTNWLNHKTCDDFGRVNVPKDRIVKSRITSIFKIDRPAFDAGKSYVQSKNGVSTLEEFKNINKRNGTGNRNITRPNFIAPPIQGRTPIGFAKLQAGPSDTFGTKELGDKLSELLSVAIPDPTDTQWLEEKDRLTAVLTAQLVAQGVPVADRPAIIARELEVNKPLGREQRTKQSKENIATATLSTSKKLEEVKQEIVEGRAESRTQQVQLLGQLALILTDTNAIEALTTPQLQDLGQSLARLGAPRTYKQLEIPHRFVDRDFYNTNAGIINLLLFSRVTGEPNTNQYNYDRIVNNFTGGVDGLPAMKLTSAIAALGVADGGRRYLDLERGGVISRAQLRTFAQNTPNGFVSPLFSILPANQ